MSMAAKDLKGLGRARRLCPAALALALAVAVCGCSGGFHLRGTQSSPPTLIDRAGIAIEVSSRDPELRYTLTAALHQRGFRVVMQNAAYSIAVSEGRAGEPVGETSELEGMFSMPTETQRYALLMHVTDLGSGARISKIFRVETDYTNPSESDLIETSLLDAVAEQSREQAVRQATDYLIRWLADHN